MQLLLLLLLLRAVRRYRNRLCHLLLLLLLRAVWRCRSRLRHLLLFLLLLLLLHFWWNEQWACQLQLRNCMVATTPLTSTTKKATTASTVSIALLCVHEQKG
jgi:hypothetical protein